MPDKRDIELWRMDSTTQWFIDNLVTHFGNVREVDTWKHAANIERLRGIAAVMDLIDGLLTRPKDYS